ncbi:hypothetical protein ACF061_03560 [Streptomyces sp. NPDC015220]|uniref:hypothetical protein n=1 Tax=Streptomyces sp. NPDC015220 TaxID=3364947 RepID=UPI0037033D91
MGDFIVRPDIGPGARSGSVALVDVHGVLTTRSRFAGEPARGPDLTVISGNGRLGFRAVESDGAFGIAENTWTVAGPGAAAAP